MTGLVVERPVSGAPRPFHFPELRRAAGAAVIGCHVPGRPLAALTLVVDAGAVTEPVAAAGLLSLTATLLGEGTRRRDADTFAVAAEALGAYWRADAEWDSVRVGFDVPLSSLPAAVDLLAEAVREPAFTAEDVARVRAERVAELRVDLSQPGPRAVRAFAATLFQPESRYARLVDGDPDTVEMLTREQVLEAHATRFGAEAATLVVAGDLGAVDLADLGVRLFDGWAPAAAPPPRQPVLAAAPERRIVVVDRPGAVQSMVLIGHPGPPRDVPDYVPMTTATFALGGLFSSRLMYHLREVRGYTYGAYAGFDLRRDGGVFTARTAVHGEVTVPAVVEALEQIEQLVADGISEDELDRVRRFRTGVFPVQFARPGTVAGAVGDLVVHGWPDDHFDRVREEIAAVTLDEVNAAARRRMHPAQMSVVVVGDAASIADGLRAAGIGPVTVVEDQP